MRTGREVDETEVRIDEIRAEIRSSIDRAKALLMKTKGLVREPAPELAARPAGGEGLV
jgi:hypothetical protein